MNNTHEEQIEREATRDEGLLFIELVVAFHNGIEDEELVYEESEKEDVEKIFKEACKVAEYDNDTVLTEIRMFERWTYKDDTIEKNEISNT